MFQATTRSENHPISNIDQWPNLRAFAEAYLADFPRSFRMQPPIDYMRRGRGSQGTIMFRSGAFQAEYVVFSPGHKVGPHVHPNVSSYDIPLRGGGLIFLAGRKLGKTVEPKDHLDPIAARVPILAGIVHSGQAGPSGASYLSLQHWHEGRATGFITDDWRDA